MNQHDPPEHLHAEVYTNVFFSAFFHWSKSLCMSVKSNEPNNRHT